MRKVFNIFSNFIKISLDENKLELPNSGSGGVFTLSDQIKGNFIKITKLIKLRGSKGKSRRRKRKRQWQKKIKHRIKWKN